MSESNEEQADETPPQIQSQRRNEFEDITLPDNANHRSLIEVDYKRYFYILAFSLIALFVIIYQSGLLPVNLAETIASIGSGAIVVIFGVLYLLQRRANS